MGLWESQMVSNVIYLGVTVIPPKNHLLLYTLFATFYDFGRFLQNVLPFASWSMTGPTMPWA
jgi:hypothetical protein